MAYPILCAIIIILIIAFLSKNKKTSRFYIINILIIVIYNLIGWTYIFKYLDAGGASLGPGLMLIFFTCLHLAILLIVAVIRALSRPLKKQQPTKT
ncbi:hypothetical protein HDF24_06705 [Mucilaginibacter sp. X4EP1]|uniref:hypothetical protein n=1 Tax=Mucilaginibacter sp. X4EP1 TaxID=2723092 RepID=UPI0021696A9F|nr:hypothetical protein [Mucilaginibacter sp. X4EP1]MCS3813996.1 heme A synthase [Mucilaginibacter sp. X4EP1]